MHSPLQTYAIHSYPALFSLLGLHKWGSFRACIQIQIHGCVLGIDGAECSRKVASWRRVAGAIRSLVSARDLQLECARVLDETLLVPVLTYDSETMLSKEKKEKERSRIRAVQMANLRGLPGIRKTDKVPNALIRELYGVKKNLDEWIDEGVHRWFSHVEKRERDMIAKSLCKRVCG